MKSYMRAHEWVCASNLNCCQIAASVTPAHNLASNRQLLTIKNKSKPTRSASEWINYLFIPRALSRISDPCLIMRLLSVCNKLKDGETVGILCHNVRGFAIQRRPDCNGRYKRVRKAVTAYYTPPLLFIWRQDSSSGMRDTVIVLRLVNAHCCQH